MGLAVGVTGRGTGCVTEAGLGIWSSSLTCGVTGHRSLLSSSLLTRDP